VPAPISDCPEQQVLDREVFGLLDAAVASLPAIQRVVISLRDIEGWNADEVCSALKLTDGNQRVLLHRARVHVRRRLQPYLHSDALTLAPT
jgi:RNA polymerase sigma-70 factor, ECF subfamily